MEKEEVLVSDGIGHCEKKCSYEHVSNFEWLPRVGYLNLQIIVKKERFLTINFKLTVK
jgi:hypothetical protein